MQYALSSRRGSKGRRKRPPRPFPLACRRPLAALALDPLRFIPALTLCQLLAFVFEAAPLLLEPAPLLFLARCLPSWVFTLDVARRRGNQRRTRKSVIQRPARL